MTREDQDSIWTVVLLVFILLILAALLVYLYRWLNRKTDGEYTVRQLIYGKGGARERLQSGIQSVEGCLGMELWPHKSTEGEADGGRGGGDTEDRGGEEGVLDVVDEDNREGDDSSDDYSSMGGVELRQQQKLDQKEEEEEQPSSGACTGGGLLVDLKQFSGSAIWQEEKNREGKVDECDLTAL